MQAIWRLLLDEDFLHAYEHGIVITFADGVTRRVFPRIFTYSADYPEKYVVPGHVLCRLLVLMSSYHSML